MTVDILSSGVLDPIGPDARRPVIVAFLIFVGGSLLWLFALTAGEEESPKSLYTADRNLSPVFNGVALAGEHVSVITLVGTSGLIALYGYDGFTFAVDILLTLGVLLLLAQKIRNSGCRTLGDIFTLRARGAGPRIAAHLVTLTITIPLLVVQLRAAGIVTALLIGLSTPTVQIICTVLMGAFVTCLAALGSMRSTSYMHIVKVPLVLAALAILAWLSLRKFDWNPGTLMSAAAEKSVAPDAYLSPGLLRYATSARSLDTLGSHLEVILGAAVMPQMILRVSASRTGRSARRSASIAVRLVGIFIILLIAISFAAAAVVGAARISAIDAAGQSSLVLLASDVLHDSSPARVALITGTACAVFLTVLTTVTSATFAAAVSLARDVYAQGKRRPAGSGEVRSVRFAATILGIVGFSLAAVTHYYPAEFLATFAMSVAASCIFPALIYSFFWRGFNRRGLLWSVYGGLVLCVIFTLLSPTVSGAEFSVWPQLDFNWYPFQSPGLLSVPAAFILGWLGSITAPSHSEAKSQNEAFSPL